MKRDGIRPSLTAEEAAVIQAALLFWRDTYLNDPIDHLSDSDEAEIAHLNYTVNRIRVRIHKALRRRGYPVLLDE